MHYVTMIQHFVRCFFEDVRGMGNLVEGSGIGSCMI